MINVKFKKTHIDAQLPTKGSEGAAGYDLATVQDFVLAQGQRMLVDTGLKIALPPGVEAQVRPRSGLALKKGITVLNSPGTIDEDYRGSVGVILINFGEYPVQFTKGDRVAQLVIKPVVSTPSVKMEFVSEFDETARGESGYGSTGV